jgi:hypothetical protein
MSTRTPPRQRGSLLGDLDEISTPGTKTSVLGPKNASNVLAGIGVDHHEINLAFGPVVNLFESRELWSFP